MSHTHSRTNTNANEIDCCIFILLVKICVPSENLLLLDISFYTIENDFFLRFYYTLIRSFVCFLRPLFRITTNSLHSACFCLFFFFSCALCFALVCEFSFRNKNLVHICLLVSAAASSFLPFLFCLGTFCFLLLLLLLLYNCCWRLLCVPLLLFTATMVWLCVVVVMFCFTRCFC